MPHNSIKKAQSRYSTSYPPIKTISDLFRRQVAVVEYYHLENGAGSPTHAQSAGVRDMYLIADCETALPSVSMGTRGIVNTFIDGLDMEVIDCRLIGPSEREICRRTAYNITACVLTVQPILRWGWRAAKEVRVWPGSHKRLA
jgi:hypothetical protein